MTAPAASYGCHLPNSSQTRRTSGLLPCPGKIRTCVPNPTTPASHLEYDLEFATLRSVSGYARSKVEDLDDCSGAPFLLGCVRGVDPDRIRAMEPGDPAGLARRRRYSPGSSGQTTSTRMLSAVFTSSPRVLTPPTRNGLSNSDETAFAVFSQGTLRFAERWSITAGVRLSQEEQRLSDVGTGTPPSPALASANDDWDGTSWRLDLDVAATDDALLYAGVSTGFKSGGITANRLPSGELNHFDPENLTAFEAGVKTQWLDRRLTLNAAAFFYDVNDMQITSTYFSGTQVFNEVENAASAEIYGIDAAGDFRMTDRLNLSGGVVWMPKREFVEYQSSTSNADLSGNQLSRAPEWTVSTAIDYELPMSDWGSLSGRLEYNFRSEFFFTADNNPLLAQGDFGLLNAFLRFESADDAWYAFASARNLTDEDYFNQILLQASPGYPDTYEIGFGYRF